ncbi:hypothetical protein HQ346_10185 [Rhodococcus sp. BP-252]|uniref:hypothetical protein n=1 Tax=unclassified Rhodococcus (in: high G+C Gram-positive bacteria) TaxID=192944 RepID=UPI001C9ABF78|nr:MULTISPECIES: hypothetical protein [unclassified Rhodococcus (in: high G+C Gram-positive bacteria)]MBY6412346.1 hypothetical protein [Rhodococcus sp. BP-320]MBY6416926.1 hypothetical protein [Rhodococcus sp. BP-321]MBY6421536.1 hypothetical protein [Rhodococcus sp. BP-324]MBY6426802.1 hypothetical protein [Rhodococcus sp. BP-323]MBY6431968.1 hypothetical protein [Rhodococcus sp. BP-322]
MPGRRHHNYSTVVRSGAAAAVAVLLAAAVVDMPAVTSTRVRATRRTVSVALTAHPGTDCAAMQKQAKTAVDDALSSLTKPSKVTVSASTGRTRS